MDAERLEVETRLSLAELEARCVRDLQGAATLVDRDWVSYLWWHRYGGRLPLEHFMGVLRRRLERRGLTPGF